MLTCFPFPFVSDIVVRVMNDFVLGEKKNMNLPGVVVDLPTITEKDRHDIAGFGLRYNVDMIAASFVRKAEDIAVIREVLGDAGAHVKIIAKASRHWKKKKILLAAVLYLYSCPLYSVSWY